MESLSLSLSIIFTSGAVRQGKDTIMRREAENRLTLAFYRITCWENSDFWAPLSSYLFIHIYIYLLYLSIYISIYLPIYLYLFLSFPLEQSFDRQGWSEMLEGEGACGKFHEVHAGKFRSEPEGKRAGGMEGHDSRSPPGSCAETFIPRAHLEYGSERFVQERLFNTCVCHNIIIFYKLSEHIISVFTNMQSHEDIP